MCKELPVIPVYKVVDPKRIIGKKWRGRGGEAQWVADPKKGIEPLVPKIFFIIAITHSSTKCR
jgi:hypothetical protein